MVKIRGPQMKMNSGEAFYKPFTELPNGSLGPSYLEPAVNSLRFPRLGRQLTANVSLPYQQARAIAVNALFQKLPEGHG